MNHIEDDSVVYNLKSGHMHNRSEVIPEPRRSHPHDSENDLEGTSYSIESLGGGRSTAPIITQIQQISDVDENQYFIPNEVSSNPRFQNRRKNHGYHTAQEANCGYGMGSS